MSKGLQKACKELRMVTVEARALLLEVAGPRRLGESVKAHLRRTARKLGWEFPRTSNIYYDRARIIRAEEWIRLNEEAAALAESAKARQGELHVLDLLARSAATARRQGAR